jgi:CheY-like chemotaxis protein
MIRSRYPEARIVVTSAFAHASHALQAAAESGDAFLTKPFRNPDLVAALTPALVSH